MKKSTKQRHQIESDLEFLRNQINRPGSNYPKGGVCAPIYVVNMNGPGEPIIINKRDTAKKPYERELSEPTIVNTSNEALDLTKILEVGDVVTTERFGDVRITRTDDRSVGGQPILGAANGIWRTWTREGFWDVDKKGVERLKPKNGKTWAQFIAEKQEKKQQIPTLEKAIEDIKKSLEMFDEPEVEVHMTLKKLKSGGYAPSKIHITNH